MAQLLGALFGGWLLTHLVSKAAIRIFKRDDLILRLGALYCAILIIVAITQFTMNDYAPIDLAAMRLFYSIGSLLALVRPGSGWRLLIAALIYSYALNFVMQLFGLAMGIINTEDNTISIYIWMACILGVLIPVQYKLLPFTKQKPKAAKSE